jgi:hypothetical protein
LPVCSSCLDLDLGSFIAGYVETERKTLPRGIDERTGALSGRCIHETIDIIRDITKAGGTFGRWRVGKGTLRRVVPRRGNLVGSDTVVT